MSTTLPTIVKNLHGSDFIWVAAAYTISSTAVLPLVGGLAATLGRKPILLGFIALFAAGSAICGAAQSMNMLIAGRGQSLRPRTVEYHGQTLGALVQWCRGLEEAAACPSRKLYTRT